MTRQFGCCLSVLSLSVSIACGGERTACPSPTPAVPHPLPTVPVSLPRPPLAERDLSPVEHIRRAADHLEAAAIGPIAEEMCERADELRKRADTLERDAAAQLAELRQQLSEIQAQIRQLEQLSDLPHPTQIQVDLKIIELDVTKAKQLGLEVTVVKGDHCESCSDQGADEQVETIQLLSAIHEAGGCKSLDGVNQEPLTECTLLPTKAADSFMDKLVEQGIAKVLTQPRLVTTSGRPASLHIGGEFPIITSQEVGKVSVEWREFGVKAEVVPVVLDNGRLRLDVAPEISERDFSHSVQVEGTVVPGITTRRINTQVEMEFGQTLVIGGLTSTSKSCGLLEACPIANKVPYISRLFRAVPTEKRLVILATPTRVGVTDQ